MKLLLLTLLLAAATAQAQSTNSFPDNSQAVQQGKAVYDRTCTACHGPDAGAGERAPAIVSGAATPLRGERSESQILAIIRDGVPGTAMPPWKTRLSDDDILRIGAYIHSLRGMALDNPLPGDPVRGEAVFWGKGQCGTCHAIYGRGGLIGPDLSNIAAVRKSTALGNALTKAEYRVYGDGGVHLPAIPPMNYQPVHVVTRDGATLDGVMRNQDAWSIQFMDRNGRLHSFDRSQLASVTIKPGSIMPTDYDKRLSPDEFKDLMAFLTRQGRKPGPQSAGVE